jgi:hypothetical protein
MENWPATEKNILLKRKKKHESTPKEILEEKPILPRPRTKLKMTAKQSQ